MTQPNDNELLRAAEAHARYCQESSDGIQVAAAIVTCVGILVAAFLILHIVP